MADDFSRITGFDDEMIMNAEAVLLTFRKIGKDVFPDAMQAAIDMSAVMGQDLQSSVVQLGKALNDPIEGVAALKRVGVTFNDEQMRTIKNLVASNDLLGAQTVILKELESEFGGAAKSMEEASTGSDRMKIAFGNWKEELGKGMIPAQRQWNLELAETFDRLAEAAKANNEYTAAVNQVRESYGMTSDQLKGARSASAEFNAEFHKNVQEVLYWTNYGKAWEERLSAETQGINDLSAALANVDYKSLLDLTINLSSETAKFNEQQEKVRSKQAEIKSEIDTLIAQGWTPLSDKVMDLQKKYDDLGLEYDANAQKHQAATNKILFDLMMQKLSVDGVTDAEFQMAMKFGEMTGQIDSGSAQQAIAFNKVTDAVMDGKLKIEDTQRVLDLMKKGYTIDVAIKIVNKEALTSLQNAGYTGNTFEYGGKREGGGDVFSGQYYVVGEKGPEIFAPGMDGQIMPNISSSLMSVPMPAIAGSAGNGMVSGGGAVPVQFVYQPFIGVNDEYEATRKLRGIIDRVNRERSNQ
jgi:hypothetical protein